MNGVILVIFLFLKETCLLNPPGVLGFRVQKLYVPPLGQNKKTSLFPQSL